MFHGALVSRVYRLQKYLKDMTPYYKTRISGMVTPKGSDTSSETETDSIATSKDESGLSSESSSSELRESDDD